MPCSRGATKRRRGGEVLRHAVARSSGHVGYLPSACRQREGYAQLPDAREDVQRRLLLFRAPALLR